MEINDKIDKLKNEGYNIWSYSRLGTFHNCELEYYNTYIKKNRGIGNCYTFLGSELHSYIEDAYRENKTNFDDFNQVIHDKLFEMDIMGMDFPSEKIKESYVKDLDHFTKNFKKLSGNFELEKPFLLNVDNIYIRGFIDFVLTEKIENGNSKVTVIDWKSSSKFTGKKKLLEAGRQLVIYKLALEQTSDLKIDNVKWCMLKYVYVNWKLKNGKLKQKMVNRGKIISEMKATFEKEMINSGINEFEVETLLFEAEQKNDISILPKCITDNYWITDCFVEYEVTDNVVSEVKEYVKNTVSQIESKSNDVNEWNHVNFDEEGTFYCNTLCSHRQSCEFIKEYNKKNQFKKSY